MSAVMATTPSGISKAMRVQSPTLGARDCVPCKRVPRQLVRIEGGFSKEVVIPFGGKLMSYSVAESRAPRISCSSKEPQHCGGECGSSRHWRVRIFVRNLFYLPREYTAVEDEEAQEQGEDGFLLCVRFSLVGLVGGLSVLLSLAGEPAMASPAHEFVEINSGVDEAAFLGCPVRGRAAPLSLLLR